jgi:hypothetical protein
VLVLLGHGAKVHLIDNMSNSFPRVWEHMKKLAGDLAGQMVFTEVTRSAADMGACHLLLRQTDSWERALKRRLTRQPRLLPHCSATSMTRRVLQRSSRRRSESGTLDAPNRVRAG